MNIKNIKKNLFEKYVIGFVFLLLLIVTVVEVLLGVIKPAIITNNFLLGISILNHIFIILTLIKAYYITWYFMHVKYETRFFRLTLLIPVYIFVPYLLFVLAYEAIM